MPGSSRSSSTPHARIADILPDSIAADLALQPGDVLHAVNGVPLTDFIAYRFAVAEELVTLEISRGAEHWAIEIEKDADADLGLVFAGDVFDAPRACRNACVFCFEEQMPAGMRPSLRLRDDDFRLSFLHGNFLTLTNLRDGDMARIIDEHLSPLFVSIHATDLDVRRRLLRNRRAPDLRAQLQALGAGGITVHGQIVLCPGWNDGAVLEQTLADLADLFPTVLSVGIVPVGLTAHRPAGPEVRPVTTADARRLLTTVARWQGALRPRLGTRLVFAADEFYLSAGRAFPPATAYEAFPQLENGIGMARQFLNALRRLSCPDRLPAGKVTLVTGTLAAPLLARLADRMRAAGGDVEVVPVPNAFYGGGVSVAGLLTGRDVLATLRRRDLGRLVLLPSAMVNADGVLLDDLPAHALASALGVPVCFCADPAEAFEAIRHVG